MTRIKKCGWRGLIVLLAALACAGTWAASQVRSVRDRSEVARMTEKMKTVCVGRFLIDVPAQAQVALAHETIGGFDIQSYEENDEEFRQRIAAREAEISARGTATDRAGGMIQARSFDAGGKDGRTFIYGRYRSYYMEGDKRIDIEYVSVESHAHFDGMSFTLSAKYADEARAKLAEVLLARLKLRGEDEIPSVPGFCIDGAVFTEPLFSHNAEGVTMFVGFPGHPDLALALFSIAHGTPGPGLLARMAEVDANASAEEMLRITKLRSGPRTIDGMAGEEVGERVREFNFTTGYAFNWETQGVRDDPRQPYLSLEFRTGANERQGGPPVESSLHEDAVLALWDSISSTLRLRKDDPPPPGPPPAPEGPKLGATARAGEVCPQSGWWQCAPAGDGLRVHGGQVQFVRKGERMPQALLLPRQTVWQKFRGIQPSLESDQPTTWQLVDKRVRPRATVSLPLAPAGAATLDVAAVAGRDAPVGSYVRTGDRCPASGWWRCEESHALDGTRWFAAGSLLPAATFRVSRGMFERGDGPETIQRRSSWQLVRRADGPPSTA